MTLSKTAKYVFILLFLIVTPLYADRYLVEAKVGSFHPFSEDLRDLYSDEWVSYQLEVSYTPFSGCNPYWWSNIFAWGAYTYLYEHGQTRSRVEDDETDIQFYNFSLGLKYIQPFPCNTRAYVSGGLRYFFLRTDNRDTSVDRRERANGLGGAFGFGVIVQPYRCFVMDFFSDISLKKFSESNFTKSNDEVEQALDASGIVFGIGVGIIF